MVHLKIYEIPKLLAFVKKKYKTELLHIIKLFTKQKNPKILSFQQVSKMYASYSSNM